MATTTESESKPKLEVLPNQYDGWDVKHENTADAISNHPTKEQAVEAAHKIAEHEDGGAEVVVKERAEEPVSDSGRGMKFYFLVLLGLLALVTLIIVIVSAIGGTTEFGANDAIKGEGTVLSPLLTLPGS
jgi:cobalamin biosynthesis Mg chelatase CobN